MSASVRSMSLKEFLAWEEGQELRYEFDGRDVFAMTGGTEAHSVIQANLLRALGNRLAGTPCRAFGLTLKIEVAGSIRYPDVFVACSPVVLHNKLRRDPVVVFEILSPSTARVDKFVKNDEYAATPSIVRYVILEQDFLGATVFSRAGGWSGVPCDGTKTLAMPEIGIEVPVAELYDGLEFPSV